MTKYYGIGSWWKNTRGVITEDLIKNERACISAHTPPTKTKKRIRFHSTFLSIKEEDFIYLKSFFRLRNRKRKIRVKAIGKVTCTKDNNKIITFEDDTTGYCIKVKWYRYDFKGLQDIYLDSLHDAVDRTGRVYQETNDTVIKIIKGLIK